MSEIKKTLSYDEDVKAEFGHNEMAERGHGIDTPLELQNLSEDEIAAIKKSATRKIDLLIMPVMVLLYM